MQSLIDWTLLNSKPVTNSANALVRYEGHLRINDNELISRSVLLDSVVFGMQHVGTS